MPVITVIIPVFNGELFIERSVNSVVNQPNSDKIEIIIVNDGSTDNTRDICENLVSINNNVYLINKTKGGVSSARNIGIKKATGKYIAFLDSDDWWEDAILDKQLLLKLSDKNSCDIYQFSFREVDCFERLEKIYIVKEKVFSYATFGFNRYDWSSPCSYIYRKDFLSQHQLVYPNAKVGEDGVFVEEALYWAQTFERVNRVLFTYYENLESCVHTTSVIEGLKENFKALYQEQKYFEQYHVNFDATVTIVWKCVDSLPKCCATHKYADVKFFMDDYCYNNLKERKDIHFGDKLWKRLEQFEKQPYRYWLKCRIVIGVPILFKKILYTIPYVSVIFNYMWNRCHRRMIPYKNEI